MAISIRRAAPEDVDDLHKVAARTFHLACPPGTPQSDVDAFVAAQLSAERFLEYAADERRILLLAEVDGTPAGYAMLNDIPIADPDVRAVVDSDTSIELSKFYVDLDRHRAGVGGALMAACLEAAAATGAKTCWLGVNQLNERAARFYEKNGFTVQGTKRFLVGAQWHDDHVRSRPLP